MSIGQSVGHILNSCLFGGCVIIIDAVGLIYARIHYILVSPVR
jgi:hypothetical protein